MKKYLLLGVGLALLSCSATKPLPHYTAEQQAEQRASIGYWQPEPAKRDSSSGPRVEPNSQLDFIKRIFAGKPPVVQQDLPGDYIATPDSLRFVKVPKPARRLFGLLPVKAPLSQGGGVGGGVPSKCKGCTFNLVAGNQTNQQTGKKATGALGDGATASVVGKNAGPAVVASDGSTQNALLGGGNLAAVQGDGNTLPQTTTMEEASDWRAELAKPAGEVAATALGLALVAGIVWAIIAYKRRKALSTNA